MSTSVFARVDQAAMVARVGSGGGDLTDSLFFDHVRPSGSSDHAFRDGLLAFGGVKTSEQSPHVRRPEVVIFTGPLVEDRAACIAFIERGPDGVRRR